MSIYKKSFIIIAVLSIISLIIGIILNYCFDEEFWCNVCLGIFGSSILTSISSIVGYSVEKKNSLEGFYSESRKMLKFINTYQADLALADKIDFFLDMANYDVSTWDLYFTKMDFLIIVNEKRFLK